MQNFLKKLKIRNSVRTIRGAVVNPGMWALSLPVLVALVLLRMAAPAAWRTPRGAALIAADIFAIGLSVYVGVYIGWSKIGTLLIGD